VQDYGIDQLWGIALRAQNTDVSLTAINHLNNHYISCGGGGLEEEEEFVQKCMRSITDASNLLDKVRPFRRGERELSQIKTLVISLY